MKIVPLLPNASVDPVDDKIAVACFLSQKPSPRIAFRHGRQEVKVKDFLKSREIIKRIKRRMPNIP